MAGVYRAQLPGASVAAQSQTAATSRRSCTRQQSGRLPAQLSSRQTSSDLADCLVGWSQPPGRHLAVRPARAQAVRERPSDLTDLEQHAGEQGPRVLIAGGGIGGLVLAVALLRRGFKVQVFERDLTAIRGEGKYRGPIQLQSNALAALEAIDPQVADRILSSGCITGDRINGLCDGKTGNWYVKFDTFHPAVERGLPVTRVVGRTLLQAILAEATTRLGGPNIIMNGAHVVEYKEEVNAQGKRKVIACLEDGNRIDGDILVGADGIRSKVRKQMLGDRPPNYSEYTCYTGIANFTPPDIDTVGYRVFLGNRQYFVSSDVGDGMMQWYAFHHEPAGGKDPHGQQKRRLLNIFSGWTDMVTDLIKATPEEDVIRRDIYDRAPTLNWTQGHVCLLGDSAHAMQPNLGQGGGMAIEDGFQLALDLGDAAENAKSTGKQMDIVKVLRGYQNKRVLRSSTIHGLAGMAAIAASTYKAYMGEGLGPLSWITQYKIPHFGRVGGYFAMNATMPSMLSWVLGGNSSLSGANRPICCHINDKPNAFPTEDFYKFLQDDDALLRASRAQWMLVPAGSIANTPSGDPRELHVGDMENGKTQETFTPDGMKIARPMGSIDLEEEECVIGSDSDCQCRVECTTVAKRHAVVSRDQSGDWHLKWSGEGQGIWCQGKQLTSGRALKIRPGDVIEVGKRNTEKNTFQVKLCHLSIINSLAGHAQVAVPERRHSEGQGKYVEA
ncbi:hypothetical protein WJX74_003141 [Apatococcus lobatus]|uniref:Zeaxanthin epoxidase, chloroplastic n=1 Tax=Apatococcus lobatus TaxID=904363 RepID=A0AAW1RP36_9CHLO